METIPSGACCKSNASANIDRAVVMSSVFNAADCPSQDILRPSSHLRNAASISLLLPSEYSKDSLYGIGRLLTGLIAWNESLFLQLNNRLKVRLKLRARNAKLYAYAFET